MAIDTTTAVPETVARDIEELLYDEAELLDDRRFEEWLELLADDIRYRMPARVNRMARERAYEDNDEAAHFQENKFSLGVRVRRLSTGFAWAEDPPSRTRRLVTNIRVRPGRTDGEYEVRSNFLLYRTRLETEQDLFAGCRHDVVRRRADGRWEIARRTILLDQNVLLGKNLSVFF